MRYGLTFAVMIGLATLIPLEGAQAAANCRDGQAIRAEGNLMFFKYSEDKGYASFGARQIKSNCDFTITRYNLKPGKILSNLQETCQENRRVRASGHAMKDGWVVFVVDSMSCS